MEDISKIQEEIENLEKQIKQKQAKINSIKNTKIKEDFRNETFLSVLSKYNIDRVKINMFEKFNCHDDYNNVDDFHSNVHVMYAKFSNIDYEFLYRNIKKVKFESFEPYNFTVGQNNILIELSLSEDSIIEIKDKFKISLEKFEFSNDQKYNSVFHYFKAIEKINQLKESKA